MKEIYFYVSLGGEGESMEVDQYPGGQGPDLEAPLEAPRPGLTCLPQRAALLKSMLNFLKKAIQDPAFRHISIRTST